MGEPPRIFLERCASHSLASTKLRSSYHTRYSVHGDALCLLGPKVYYSRMTDWGERFQADKAEGTVLVIFVPSVDRHDEPIDQQRWESEALSVLGRLFGGATAFPQGHGVWRDDDQGGRLVFDAPVIIQCYTSLEAIDSNAVTLREFLVQMGTETGQGAVGFVIDRTYLEIKLPHAKE